MEFVREYRIGSAELDARDVEPELVPACEAEAGRYRDALTTLESHRRRRRSTSSPGRRVGPGRARHLLGHPRRAPADRHPSRPPAADRDGPAIPSASVRRARAESGCPSAPTSRASSTSSPSSGSSTSAPISPLTSPPRPRCADRHRRTDRVPDRLGGRAVALVVERLSLRHPLCGLPRQVAARLPSLVDRRRALRPDRRRRARPRAGARRSPATSRARLAGYRTDAGRRGLLTFAIDTELLGHWWWEGPIWLEQVLIELPALGVRRDHAEPGTGRARGRGAAARRLDLGRGQGSPHLGLAAGRRSHLGGAAIGDAGAAGGVGGTAARPGPAQGRPGAARGAGERLGVPRLRPPDRRLPLSAPARPLAGAVRGHRMRRVGRIDDAQPRAGPLPGATARTLSLRNPFT